MTRVWMLVVATVAAAGCGRIGFDLDDGGGPNAGGVDLESTIEMIGGASLSADGSNTIDWDRSRTAFDPADYDGAVTTFFEIVATNGDTQSYDIDLIDTTTSAAVVAVTVPAMTSVTRFRSPAFTAPAGARIYVVRTPPGPSASNTLGVYDARIVVRQVGATTTRLYFPLMATEQLNAGSDNSTDRGPADGVNSTTYQQANADHYSLWNLQTSRYATIAAGAAWTFDAVLNSHAAGDHAFASLFDQRTGTQVMASEVTTNGSDDLEYQAADFANDATGFVDGDDFQAELRGDDGASIVYIFKAGLWLRLVDLSRAEIQLRIGGAIPTQARRLGSTTDAARADLDAAAFSNPIVTFEAVARGSTVSLIDGGSDDVGATGPQPPGSTLSFGTPKARLRTPALALAPDDRFFVDAATTTVLTNAMLAVDISSP